MFCRECGTKNADDAIYCENCGKLLERSAENSTQNGRLVETENKNYLTATYKFDNMTYDSLVDMVDNIFTERGYKLEKGEMGNGIYGKGSGVLSFISDGLAKRYKFKVNVYTESDNMCLMIRKEKKSAATWSTLGILRQDSEFRKIKEIFNKIN